jgi:hypothetical protein
MKMQCRREFEYETIRKMSVRMISSRWEEQVRKDGEQKIGRLREHIEVEEPLEDSNHGEVLLLSNPSGNV